MVKVVSKILFFFVILFVSQIPCNAQVSDTIVKDTNNYSFVVAGHAYGAHTGTNKGLYPKFLKSIKNNKANFDFTILNGDIVRDNNSENFITVIKELDSLKKPYYFVMGNNDVSKGAYRIFTEKFGNSYYYFKIKTDLFIILDSRIEKSQISEAQLSFIKNVFSLNNNSKNVFIFFSDLLWNQNVRYENIKTNKASRYLHIQQSNFWYDLMPILKKYPNKSIYIIAGDVAGNVDAIPVFYEKNKNITFIASGMGEVKDENYLLVNIADTVSFKLMPLNSGVNLNNIKEYNIKSMSSHLNSKKDIIITKLKRNFTHIQFIRGVIFTSSFFIFFIIIYFLVKWKLRKNKTSYE